MYELTGEIFSVSLLFVWLDNGEYLFAKEETFDDFYLCCIMNIQNENKVRGILLYKIQNR